MADIKALRSYVEDIRSSKPTEVKWKKLRKWLIDELGATERKNTGGSHRSFEHPMLGKYEPPGIFQVAVKKDKIVYLPNCLRLFKRVDRIIDLLEKEDSSENQGA